MAATDKFEKRKAMLLEKSKPKKLKSESTTKTVARISRAPAKTKPSIKSSAETPLSSGKVKGSRGAAHTKLKASSLTSSNIREVNTNHYVTQLASNFNAEDSALQSLDQMAELLKGFESASDAEQSEDSASVRKQQSTHSNIPLTPLPSVLGSRSSATEASKIAQSAKQNDEAAPVVLYVGRIPHGFYEHQMRAYFSQFGDIAHLRLAHNRRTGAVKHYGFIQFVSDDVGRIVQKTMDKYLLFGHLLQVKEIPRQRLEELEKRGVSIWKDEGKRFRSMPWRGIDRGKLKSASREEWESRVQKEKSRREKKSKKLRELGYDFDIPEIRKVDNVPIKGQRTSVDGTGAGEAQGNPSTLDT